MTKPDFTVIENKKEIKRAQRAFAKNMKKKATKHGELRAAHQGGEVREKLSAYWFKDCEFWWGYPKSGKPLGVRSPTPRWWNAFRFLESNIDRYRHGPGVPNWDGKQAMTVEINIPVSGNRWTGGVFVKDSDGEIYIAHTGLIGGGRTGIGKTAFANNYPGRWNQASGSRGEKDVVIVSKINDPDLIDNVGFFVKIVHKIKDKVRSGKIQKKQKLPRQKSKNKTRQKNPKFNKEPDKRGSYTVEGKIQAELKHFKVINQLQEICENQGCRTSNSKRYDLLISKKSKKSLMEAKTDWDSYSRYEAIGQLLYYSFIENLPKNTKLVAVFPKPKKSYLNRQREFKKVLGKHGIKFITYTWHNKKPKFDRNLGKILKDL